MYKNINVRKDAVLLIIDKHKLKLCAFTPVGLTTSGKLDNTIGESVAETHTHHWWERLA